MRATNAPWIAACTAALALPALAQTRPPAPPPPDRSIVTAEAPREAARNNKSAEDIEFLVEAMRASLAEVQLGDLATRQSYDPRVRELGAKLKSDHAEQAAEIERMLKPLGVAVPAEPSAQAELDHAALARLSGAEFDAAFLDLTRASHAQAIEKYGAETHANPDRALGEFASRSLPVLREHLAAAEALRR